MRGVVHQLAIWRLAFCLGCLAWAGSAWAQGEARAPRPHSFAAAPEPAQVELGRPFTYRVEVRHPAKERYDLPDPLSLDPVVVRRVEVERREAGDEGGVTTFALELLVFHTLDEVILPDLALAARDDEGPLGPLLIPGATVTIREVGEGEALEAPPEALPVEVVAWGRIAWAGVGLALLIAGSWLAARWWRRRSARVEPVSPFVRALAEIEALATEAQKARTVPERRAQYFRLSAILRGYLGGAHGVGATEMTSAELMVEVRERQIPGLAPASLEAWLDRGDLVRFAGAAAGLQELLDDLEEAMALIEGMEKARVERKEREDVA